MDRPPAARGAGARRRGGARPCASRAGAWGPLLPAGSRARREGTAPDPRPGLRPAAMAGARPAAAPIGRARPGLAGARRVARAVARRAWIACLGYRRYRYERSHPGRLSPVRSDSGGSGAVDRERLSEPARLPGRRLIVGARPVTARLRGSLAGFAAAGLGGASLGFVARDLLELLGRPAVAAAWVAGALLGLHGRGSIASEEGTATIEWVALVLVAALALGALAWPVRDRRRPPVRRLSRPPDRVCGEGRLPRRRWRPRARVRE